MSSAKTPVGNTAAICIYSLALSRLLARHLKEQGTPEIRIATVTNFHGNDDIEIALAETRAAIAYGADEVDVVLPYRALMVTSRLVLTW